MRTEMLVLAVCGSVLLSTAYADEPNKKGKDDTVREIGLTGYSRDETGVATKPTKIANVEELAKSVPNKKWLDQIAKQVDFDKEELLLFS